MHHSLATDYFAPHFLRTSPYLLTYDPVPVFLGLVPPTAHA